MSCYPYWLFSSPLCSAYPAEITSLGIKLRKRCRKGQKIRAQRWGPNPRQPQTRWKLHSPPPVTTAFIASVRTALTLLDHVDFHCRISSETHLKMEGKAPSSSSLLGELWHRFWELHSNTALSTHAHLGLMLLLCWLWGLCMYVYIGNACQVQVP